MTPLTLHPIKGMTVSAVTLDCRSCGACCACDQFMTIEVSDYDRTPRQYTGFIPGIWTNEITGQKQHGLRLMRRHDARCIALRGKVGQQVGCAIYDKRPAVCQRFEPGGEKCLAARRHHCVLEGK